MREAASIPSLACNEILGAATLNGCEIVKWLYLHVDRESQLPRQRLPENVCHIVHIQQHPLLTAAPNNFLAKSKNF